MASTNPVNPPSDQRRPGRPLFKWLVAVLLTVLATGVFLPLLGPSSAEVRSDTGDLRYRWFGIPLEQQHLGEPGRTKIATLAKIAPSITAEWMQFPAPSALRNPHLQCVGAYAAVADWSDQDQELA